MSVEAEIRCLKQEMRDSSSFPVLPKCVHPYPSISWIQNDSSGIYSCLYLKCVWEI